MRVLLTGGYGCIGCWIARQLLERGDQVCIYDLKEDHRRLRLILDDERIRQIRFIPGDVTDLAALHSAWTRTRSRTWFTWRACRCRRAGRTRCSARR